jgi:hypothetical protein
MKCRARRSEPHTTKRLHIGAPSREPIPFTDFLLASLCLSQAVGATRAACPVRAEKVPALPAEVDLAVLPDAAAGVAGARVAHVPLCAAAVRDVAAEVDPFPLWDAAQAAVCSAAVVAQSVVLDERALPLGAGAVLRLVARVAAGPGLRPASRAPRLAARVALRGSSLPEAGPASQPDERVLPFAGHEARVDAGLRPARQDGLVRLGAAADATRCLASLPGPWAQQLQAVEMARRLEADLVIVRLEAWHDLPADVPR